jgi:fluoroacetyl-CoA thioesterase
MENINAGLFSEESFLVEERHSASSVGSGGLPVLSTPSLVAFMEQTSFQLLQHSLPEGFSSVGARVELRHLAPTPVGEVVRLHCEVTEVDGRQVMLRFEAWDAWEKIGDGTHLRVIIDPGRFLQRLQNKRHGS